MKFKGNFGELTLEVEGIKATAKYQNGGIMEGEFINDTFKGTWKNKGKEGLVEFKVENGKLTGNWKQGLEPGPMKGKWEGEALEDGEMFGRFETFESKIVDRIFDGNLGQLENLLKTNLTLIKYIANNFSEFLDNYYNKHEDVIFWKQTKLDYTHKACWTILRKEDIDFDEHFESYERFSKTKAEEFIDNYNLYFPSFLNDELDDAYAEYNLRLMVEDAEYHKDLFEDEIDYCCWHVSFIIYHYLTYGVKELFEDNCENEDSLTEFSIWVHKIVGNYNFEDHGIAEKLNDAWNDILSQTMHTLEILSGERITDDDGVNKEIYCEDDSENFSAIKFIKTEFQF